MPCIRVWGKRISVKLLLLVLGAREQTNIFHILVSIFCFFFVSLFERKTETELVTYAYRRE